MRGLAFETTAAPERMAPLLGRCRLQPCCLLLHDLTCRAGVHRAGRCLSVVSHCQGSNACAESWQASAQPDLKLCSRACQRLAAANIPHNLFVADRGQRAWLLPNAFAASKAKGLVPESLLDSQVPVNLHADAMLTHSCLPEQRWLGAAFCSRTCPCQLHLASHRHLQCSC